MREIIFRGKRKLGNEWIEGSLHTEKFADDEEYLCCEINQCDVYPETVGQYTGLLDKNGNRIFEGDIVESRASDNKEDWKRWIVTFYDGSFCFEREISRKRKHKHEQNLLCVDEVKLYGLAVIGNIHDNPEFLKGE